jgi:hypothetical protein
MTSNAAQRLKEKVLLARKPELQKMMKEMIDAMEKARVLTRKFPGPLDPLLVEMLTLDGFHVESHTTQPSGDCDCDYTQSCRNRPQTWVTVSVPEN